MNRNAWSDEDKAEHDLICHESVQISPSTAGRTEAYLSRLRDAEQSHRYFALDCLQAAVHDGAAKQLKAWQDRQRQGRIAVRFDGKDISKRRIIGATAVDDEGNSFATQTLFDFMTREQLQEKVREYAINIEAFKTNLYTAVRLLELMDHAPGAATPAEAARVLGTSLEDYLTEAA
jgi:hypothetical protein